MRSRTSLKLFVFAVSTLAAAHSLAADPPRADAKTDAKGAPPAAAPPAAPAADAGKSDPKKPTDAAPPAPAATGSADGTAPKPPAELLAAVKPLLGKWKCDGKVPQTTFTQAHPIKADMTWASNLGGYFITVRYDEKKDKANKEPYAMSSVIGWDPQAKGLSRIDYDNLGMISKLTATGFVDKTLVWSGEVQSGQTVGFKETVKQKTPKLISITQELAGPDGAFVVIGEMSCKK